MATPPLQRAASAAGQKASFIVNAARPYPSLKNFF
jgi:hypothetical protein